MPIPPGHIGNLTAEQEVKLRELWIATLRTFGVKDPTLTPSGTSIPDTPLSISAQITDSETPKPPKKSNNSNQRHSLFSSKKHQDGETPPNPKNPAPSTPGTGDEDDKYGQTQEFQQTLQELTPEQLRTAFWSMVKSDHPDALLLRFLRARKWDVQRALVMLISTMRWRSRDMHVDDDIMFSGEAGARADARAADVNGGVVGQQKKKKKKKEEEGEEFMMQLRKGQSYLHGVDREGRPICFVNVRLHKPGEQSERTMERYTVFIIETARLLLKPPVETAVWLSLISYHLSLPLSLLPQHPPKSTPFFPIKKTPP